MKTSFLKTVSLLAVMGLLSGCASQPEATMENEDQVGHIKMKRPKNVTYEQISSAGCKLSTASVIHTTSGQPYLLRILLANNSFRKIHIPEWYMLDAYNFIIHYRRLPSDKPTSRKIPFKTIKPFIPIKPLPRHSELILQPGNIAELNIKLPFIEELNPGETATFEVYLSSNLQTFKIKTPVFTVFSR